VFPSPNILQHYIKFDTCTITSWRSYLVRDLLMVLSIPSSSSCHFSYFFGQVWPPFHSLDYYPCILRMLGIDRSCTCHSFLVGWSPYSFGCNSTCWDWHFSIPNGITNYTWHATLGCLFLGPTLWGLGGLILSLVIGFFGKSPERAGVCLTSSKCSFKYHANMYLIT